jgi:pimeloyl-ACP methyl ester carboxylesterase
MIDTPLPTAAAEIVQRHVRLHGRRMCYLEAGRHNPGPTVVLVHGLASDSTTWTEVLGLLGQRLHVVAPDLLGHGDSAKPSHGDYSVTAHAARLRDLVVELGVDQVSVIGHSFGGGVAMSFAYLFPERTSRLGLIASGGLGSELNLALRLASLPGAALCAHAVATFAPCWLSRATRQLVVGLGLAPASDLDALGRALARLPDRVAREAFAQTMRCSVSWSGQRLTALDHLHLLADIPTLLIAGRRDSCIPVGHTARAHRQLPTSRLEILDTGHFPQHERPHEVAQLIAEFHPPARLPSGRRTRRSRRAG